MKYVFLFFSFILMASAALAQYPVLVSGGVFSAPGSTFVDVQSVQGTSPAFSDTMHVNPTGAPLLSLFGKTFLMNDPSGTLLFSHLDCGNVVRSWTLQYNAIGGGDTLTMSYDYCGSGVPDCFGIPSGHALPGFPCDDGFTSTGNDVFDANCLCNGTQLYADCNGVLGGNDIPGSTCDDGDPNTFYDCWDASCNCSGISSSPCDATFIVYQPFDSLGQPSFGSISVVLQNPNTAGLNFLWDMGDGTSLNSPAFVHTYPGNGPYQICLTLSGGGCTDTYCDTIQADTNGLIIPGQPGANGFSVTILADTPTSIDEDQEIETFSVFPSPAAGTIQLSGVSTGEWLEMYDVQGKVLTRKAVDSSNQLDLESYQPGVYLLRVIGSSGIRSVRFVIE